MSKTVIQSSQQLRARHEWYRTDVIFKVYCRQCGIYASPNQMALADNLIPCVYPNDYKDEEITAYLEEMSGSNTVQNQP